MAVMSAVLMLAAAAYLGRTAEGPSAPAAADTACAVMNAEELPLALRESPLDSVTFRIGGAPIKICYGRPTARSRQVIGSSAVPYGRLWRTGANEPTVIHTTIPLIIAGIRVRAGSYSLYTVPNEGTWEIILNRSITQWGDESAYTEAVRAQEVGRGPAESERSEEYVAQFTIRVEPETPAFAFIVLAWGYTQVMISVSKG
jgi:hypothetical protein